MLCHSHPVWLVFEGSVATCACFQSENVFVTYFCTERELVSLIISCILVSARSDCIQFCGILNLGFGFQGVRVFRLVDGRKI